MSTLSRALFGQLPMILLVAIGFGATNASATVIYQYESTCDLSCGNIGLSAGDAVGGFIGFSDAAVAGGMASIVDVEFFDVTFGTFNFGLPSLGFAMVNFAAGGIASFDFQFITNAAGSDPGYNFTDTSWIAGPSVQLAASGGAGTLTRVPAPSTLGLLALAAVGLGFARRRRTL